MHSAERGYVSPQHLIRLHLSPSEHLNEDASPQYRTLLVLMVQNNSCTTVFIIKVVYTVSNENIFVI